MQSIRIVESLLTGLEPVGSRLPDRIDALKALISRRLGDDHAAIFAEPVPTRNAEGFPTITWFAEGDDEAVALHDLTEAEQHELRRRAAVLVKDLEGFADSLEGEGASSAEMARILRQSLTVPGPDTLWRVGGRPVLINWGYRAKGLVEGQTTPVFVTATGGASGPTAGPTPNGRTPSELFQALPPERVRMSPARYLRPVLLLPWLLVAVIAVLLASRISSSCGVGAWDFPEMLTPWLPRGCSLASSGRKPGIVAEIADMNVQVRTREAELTGRAGVCSAASTMPTSAASSISPGVADVERRLDRIERSRSLEVTLAWEGTSDLDLHVGCEDGDVSFQSPAACGARLVADMNSKGGAPGSDPVEHVIWEQVPSPGSRYRVRVVLFDRHGDTRPAIPYRILLWQDGHVIRQETSQIERLQQPMNVLDFVSSSPRGVTP